VALWDAEGSADSAACPAALFGLDAERGLEARAACQSSFMAALLDESLLFAGACMLRRLVGIAHNADFERIEDAAVRGACELRALAVGRTLLLDHGAFRSVEAVVQRARAINAGDGTAVTA